MTINIIDTRARRLAARSSAALTMVDGVVLRVDPSEGRSQTPFVLRRRSCPMPILL